MASWSFFDPRRPKTIPFSPSRSPASNASTESFPLEEFKRASLQQERRITMQRRQEQERQRQFRSQQSQLNQQVQQQQDRQRLEEDSFWMMQPLVDASTSSAVEGPAEGAASQVDPRDLSPVPEDNGAIVSEVAPASPEPAFSDVSRLEGSVVVDLTRPALARHGDSGSVVSLPSQGSSVSRRKRSWGADVGFRGAVEQRLGSLMLRLTEAEERLVRSDGEDLTRTQALVAHLRAERMETQVLLEPVDSNVRFLGEWMERMSKRVCRTHPTNDRGK